VISWHDTQRSQGVVAGPFSQLRHLARIRATEVFPVPRTPAKTYAWASRFDSILRRFPHLKALYFTDATLPAAGLPCLADLKELGGINFTSCAISDDGHHDVCYSSDSLR